MDREHATLSQDAIVLASPLAAAELVQFDFYPNRIGADNLLACRLEGIGFHLGNPCEDLPITHVHCTEKRDYTKRRVDAHSFAFNHVGQRCFMWPTARVQVHDVCRNLTSRAFVARQAARLAAATDGRAPSPQMACKETIGPNGTLLHRRDIDPLQRSRGSRSR